MGITQEVRSRKVLAVLTALLMIFMASASFAVRAVPAYAETKGQKNAINTAKKYLKKGPYSRYKLAATLKMNGYSEEDAIYAAKHCGANWNEQAARMAKEYLKYDKYTKKEMIEALEFQGFSKSQAEYGAKAAGLK